MSEAIRLTFLRENGKITLRSARRVRMRVPPGDKRPPGDVPEDLVGQWIEVKGAADQPLYRRFVTGLVPSDVEVADTGPTTAMHRVPTPPKRSVFTVLVPANPEATEVAVVERRRRAGRAAATSGFEVIRHATVNLAKTGLKREAH
jgi:hypothetical protein